MLRKWAIVGGSGGLSFVFAMELHILVRRHLASLEAGTDS
jgi:hypothetical protein